MNHSHVKNMAALDNLFAHSQLEPRPNIIEEEKKE
jgi:hypothetical protein